MLEDLEHQLEAAQALEASTGVVPWTPPAGLGPLPAELAPRAQALVAALNDAAVRTVAARDEIARQLAAVRSVPLAEDGGSSVYLDVAG
ncbi:hypothetical protein [Arthrobacter sp. JSM 101049]|uniref:hypothetical protein n=1 Tax=Arthrobacter sp. JSM 101049 TaxID=929097 RepID=UPI0035658AF3